MNTNSNAYTVIYTTIVVVLVAAILAFVSQKLGPMQKENEKAETISQVLTAAQFDTKEHWKEIGNAATVKFFEENVAGEPTIWSVSDLKALNYKVKDGSAANLPIYRFSNGISVLPIYGAGLWGPIWGYIALEEDMKTIAGAYFDHESETPGLGGKIKDDPEFRAQFKGKTVEFSAEKPFSVIKGGVPEGQLNAVDAITGATMTSKGLSAAIEAWLSAFAVEFGAVEKPCCGQCCKEESKCCGHEDKCCGGEECCGHEDKCCGGEECCGNCCKDNKTEEE